MNIYKNSRQELATTDGGRWWSGKESDETSAKLNALQPITSLFPESDVSVGKARKAFVSCLKGIAPTVKPENDAERVILRQAWDDAADFAAKNSLAAVGVPVFDCKLRLVGAADAIVTAADGKQYTYCYAPPDFRWRGETNAIVRILHHGLPIDCADDPHGCFTLAELARAVTAIATRQDTQWFRDWSAAQPF